MILIIGASGLVGSKLTEECERRGLDYLPTSTTGKQQGYRKFILGEDDPKEFIDSVLRYSQIDTAVITGAITNIHKCFAFQEKSQMVNVNGTKALIDVLVERNIKPVFFSSDAVFDGIKGGYTESDVIASSPTVYGRQKRELEEYILDNASDGLIYRISKQYDVTDVKRNLFSDIYGDAVNKKKLRCIKDLYFNPTYVGDTANSVLVGMEKGLSGLYQVAAPEFIERIELARKIVDACGIDDCVITNEVAEDFNLEEPRAFNASMDVSKFLKDSGYSFKPLNDGIFEFSQNMKNSK